MQKRILSLALLALLLLPMLCMIACGGKDTTTPTDPNGGTPASTLAQALKDEGYVLVYPDPDDDSFTAAEHAEINEARKIILAAYKSATGTDLAERSDYVRRNNPIPANAKEILLGKTNRQSSQTATAAVAATRDNSAKDFQILMGNQEVNIVAGHAIGLQRAATQFAQMLTASTDTYPLTGYQGAVDVFTWPLETLGGVAPSSWRIVYPAQGMTADFQTQIEALKQAVFYASGYRLDAVADTSVRKDYEICLGHTNRPISASAQTKVNALRNNNFYDHVLFGEGKNLALMPGSDDVGTEGAVTAFAQVLLSGSLSSAVTLEQSYQKEGLIDFTIGGVAAGKFQIVLPKDAPFDLKYNATRLRDLIFARTGYKLKIVYDTAAKTQHEILFGKVNRTASATVAQNAYAVRLSVTGSETHLCLDAGHYMGVEYAIRELIALLSAENNVRLLQGSSGTVPASMLLAVNLDDFKKSAAGINVDTTFGTDYVLAWNDEFEDIWGDGWLNTEKWGHRWSMTFPDDVTKNKFDQDVITVENGIMTLITDEYADGSRENPVSGYRYKMPDGVVTSNTFNFHYGYLEMRAAPPFYEGGSAQFPSFWLTSGECSLAKAALKGTAADPYKDAVYGIEIDIFEIFGAERELSPNLHKWAGDGGHAKLSNLDNGGSDNGVPKWEFSSVSEANEFHTYGFLWTENVMAFSVDGEFYWSYDLSDEHNFGNSKQGTMSGFRDLYLDIILNNMIFTEDYYKIGTWMEDRYLKLLDAHLPILYEVDYMRYYKLADYGNFYTKDISLA